MGMKRILRALDQALETAEAELEKLLGQVEETKAERDKLLETFRERERTWAGEREDMAGELWELRREKKRMQSTVDSLESENAKLREALEKWMKSR